MTTSKQTLDSLISAAESIAHAHDASGVLLRLKKAYPDADPALIALAVETVEARRRAPEKLGAWSSQGFFSTSLLEQASRTAIAEHRAEAFRGLKHVVEIGTGTGSDTAALAAVCDHVSTIDVDPIASDLARRNLSLRGIENVTFFVGEADAVIPNIASPVDGFFADPMRRTRGGVRVKSSDDYTPSLSWLLSLNIGAVRAFKVSPGLFVDLPTGWHREFIGFEEECLEQTLWYGSPMLDGSVFRADTRSAWSPPEESLSIENATEIEGYLVEPHALINRSGRMADFLAQRGARLIDPDVAYGISDTALLDDPFMKSFRIFDAAPYSVKRLRTLVQERGWTNRTEIKKRNFNDDPESIRKQLKLPPHSHGAPFGVVFLFRRYGKPYVVLGERL